MGGVVSAYYNEHDPYAAAWLRNLIAAGRIAPGEVDERSITEISPDDLRGFTQCHFFAGIGVWSYALRSAGWTDDRPVWTGSCPCQPFSSAGGQAGFADPRHLWPTWFNLIRECRPAIVLGEQVASALDWLDLVQTDLESAHYAFGASDLCAAGYSVEGWDEARPAEWVCRAIRGLADSLGSERLRDFADWAGASLGAPGAADHIRQRLFFVGLADADASGLEGRERLRAAGSRSAGQPAERGCAARGLADADDAGRCPRQRHDTPARHRDTAPAARGDGNPRAPLLGRDPASGLADAAGEGWRPERQDDDAPHVAQAHSGAGQAELGRHGSDRASHAPLLRRHPADWLYCRDGKWRPVRPGTFPLADAAPARVGRLRAYGNALDAETAAQFCGAVAEAILCPQHDRGRVGHRAWTGGVPARVERGSHGSEIARD